MEFKLNPAKIEKLEYMLSRVFEKDQTNKPKFCFLLGAGCSAYSGIPLGWGVIERCRTIVFLNHHPSGSKVKNMNHLNWHDYFKAAEKFRDERKEDYELFVKESEEKFRKNLSEKEVRDIIPDEIEDNPEFNLEEFTERVFNDRLYGFWLDKYDEDPRERQMFIEHIIEDIEPAGDYILFASLVDGQIIHNVLTTNFDDLLNEALINYYNNRARVYAHNEMARFISPVSKRPNVIKLHGDYLYENIKNTHVETGDLEANMKNKFSEILNRMNLVVVGYGGADHSVMSVLEMVKKDNKYCLIWCGNDPDKLNWRVVHLINSTKNSFFVPVSDFQTMVFKLWTNADLKLPDFEGSLTQKKSRLEDFLTKYKEQVKDRDEVTQKEMNVLIDKTEALKWFNKAYDEKDFGKQIEFYSKAIEYNPRDHLAYYNRAFSYNELSQFEKAIEDLNITIELDPAYTNAYINRGLAYSNLKHQENALADYTKAIELDPASVLAYGNRGLVNYDLKQYEKTIEDCNKAIELDPNYANAYINRGLASSNLKLFENALRDYNKALDLNPEMALAYSNRGLLSHDAQQFEKAIEDYNKAIELDPMYTNAYINRGLAYYSLKLFEKATKDYSMAIRLNPNYALAFVNRGLAYYDQLENKSAIEDYNKAIELNPDYAVAYGSRGLALHDSGEYENAIEDYNRAIILDPYYTNAYINRGLANYNLRNFEQAIVDYDRAIELNPEYSLAYNNRGLAKYNLLQYKEAVKDFDKAIELDPKNANAYINKGNNYFGLKQYDKACEDYSRTLELEPGNALALGNRGLAYKELKQFKEAIADYLKTIEIDPDYLVAYQNLAEIYLYTGQYSEVEMIVDKAMSKDIAIQDKALLTYLKLIAVIQAGTDKSEISKQMDQFLQEDFTSAWNLTQYEDWIKSADMTTEKQQELQAVTEKMKKKITK